MSVSSLDDIAREAALSRTFETLRRAGLACVRGALLAAPVALSLALALLVIPTVAIPTLELLALTAVSTWSLLALFLSAVLATR